MHRSTSRTWPRRELGRAWVDLEAEPLAVAREANQARRVLDEALVMQDAEPPAPRSASPLIDREQLAVDGDGERVDREVAAREILLERGRFDLGERAGAG